jgi:hypothetical protein
MKSDARAARFSSNTLCNGLGQTFVRAQRDWADGFLKAWNLLLSPAHYAASFAQSPLNVTNLVFVSASCGIDKVVNLSSSHPCIQAT